jgi:Flp pilus assembly protein TadD
VKLQAPLRFQLHLEPLAPSTDPGLGAASLRTLRVAVERRPDEADYHYILGEALLRDGRYREALESLRDAVRLSPDDPAYLCLLGEAAFHACEYEEARQTFAAALLIRDDSPQIHNLLGVALAAQGREGEALLSLQEAKRRAPDNSPVISNLGVALWRLEKTTEAMDRLRQGARKNATAESLWNLGVAAIALGRDEEAEGALRKAGDLLPQDPLPRALRGEALSRLGRPGEAAQAFQDALLLDPRCLDNLGSARETYAGLRIAEIRSEAPKRGFSWEALVFHPVEILLAALRAIHGMLGFLGSVAASAVLLAVLFVGYRAFSPYVSHYGLKDRAEGIARSALVGHDDELRELLTRAANEWGLGRSIQANDFTISTHGDLRRIQCTYTQSVELAPGWRRDFHFVIDVEEPFVTTQSP